MTTTEYTPYTIIESEVHEWIEEEDDDDDCTHAICIICTYKDPDYDIVMCGLQIGEWLPEGEEPVRTCKLCEMMLNENWVLPCGHQPSDAS